MSSPSVSHRFDLTVSDMSCEGCVRSVTRLIQNLDPAATVQIDLPTGQVSGLSSQNAAALAAALTRGGYRATLRSFPN